MPIIRSISGIRGTIGGKAGENLTPEEIISYASAYGQYIKNTSGKARPMILLGRDARPSGEWISRLITGTLNAMGIDVTDAGLATTPTVEIAVQSAGSDGGIIVSASHNPGQWNALKFLNKNGEFLTEEEGLLILELAEQNQFRYSGNSDLGKTIYQNNFLDEHIRRILALPLVDVEAIRKAEFTVAVDGVCSVGGFAIPKLLEALGVKRIEKLFCEPSGIFPHNPEPLPENLSELAEFVIKKKCHVGFAVDPDVDRLAIVNEDGTMFGEEYTLVAVADYVLQHTPGNTVSNLSSTRVLRLITEKAGGSYKASAVGEVNVVRTMRETNAVIGGEGNGGVIYPVLHYGRDALVGIALFLSYLARSGKKCSVVRYSYPNYFISKNKITLEPEMNMDQILEGVVRKYQRYSIDRTDGVWIDFGQDWVHLRKSNTEPIIRIYAESDSENKAHHLAQKMIADIREIVKNSDEATFGK